MNLARSWILALARSIPGRVVLRRLCALAALALVAAAPARAATVAITFDDLPVFGRYASAADGEKVTRALLSGFRRHRWRVIGFVNEIQLDAPDRPARIALLRDWLDAGMELGNHSYSHKSLTSTPVDAYIADVAKGEIVTRELLAERGRKEAWYRYPYLETGATAEAKRTFQDWLAAHGYRIAPVTMENSDWEFAEPYDDALAHGDTALAARIRQSYLDYTAAVVPWYIKAASQLLGREPAFVFLLHASRLNAASIDALAAIFRAQHLRSIPLTQAMRDPAYAIRDDYVGPDGDEWVTRWAMTLHKDLPYASLPQVPEYVATLDAKLEAADAPPAPVSPVGH